jgi:hypothetical protein
VSLTVTEMVAKLGLDIDEGEFAQGDKALEELRAAILGLAGVATAAATAIGAMIASTVESASAADDASKATGVSAQALIELGHAAQMSGSSAEELRDGLLHLSRSSVAAASGSAEGAEAFRKFGVSVRDGAGRLKGADALLAEVADGLGRIPEAERASAAMAIFGRSGARLVPLLSEGAGGIALLRREARELGIVIDAETIEAAASLGDSFDRATASLRALTYAVAGPLLAPMRRVIDAVVAWWRANQAIVKQQIAAVFDGIARAIRWVSGPVLLAWRGFRALFGLLEVGVRLVGGTENAVTALALAFFALTGAMLTWAIGAAATTVLGMAAVAGGVWPLTVALLKMAAAWVLAALPVIGTGLLLLGFGAILALVADDIYKFVTGGTSLLGDFVYAVTELWAMLKEAVVGAFDAAFERVSQLVQGVLDKVFSAIDFVDRMLSKLGRAAGAAKAAVFGDGNVEVVARGVAEAATTPGGVSAMFGGGASPAASTALTTNARTTNVAAPVEVKVVAAPGQSPAEVGRAVGGELRDNFGRMLAETAGTAGA